MFKLRNLTTWLASLQLVYAQTIVVGNETTAADMSTVAAAAEAVDQSSYLPAETLQLTDAVISNLTSLSLTNISLFDFGDSNSSTTKRTSVAGCKTFLGDSEWPNDLTWDVFDLLTGGALIKTVPLASSCYHTWGNYDAEKCAYVTEQWTVSTLHIEDPTSSMAPIYQGLTCIPSSVDGTCTLGGFPSYSVNISNVAQIQLAVNFARNLNLRFVVKNTGHDFSGRSVGAGAVSVWTHHLKDLKFYDTYTTSDYSGPAIKAGSGVQGTDLYDFANAHDVVAVGGECQTVGWGGGYIAGGGHSPLSPLYGMAADQVLSAEVVTPDGRFVTADENENTDLFWALRGGGGSTFGVVTSYTVKVYPETPVTSFMNMTLAVAGNITTDMFWEAIKEFIAYAPTAIDAGHYTYWYLLGSGDFPTFTIRPWFAHGYTVAGMKNITAPLFAKWAQLGIAVEPAYYEYSTYVEARDAAFIEEAIAFNSSKIAGRLVPRETLVNETQFDQFFAAFRGFYNNGGTGLVGFGITGGPAGVDVPDNAVNPAWRTNALHLLPTAFWDTNANLTEQAADDTIFTNEWMAPIRNATPGGGAYGNEADASEPDFKQSLFGADTYNRLLEIKHKYDPTGLFYANQAVGSDEWYVTDQLAGLPTQNGKLCRVSS